MSFLEDVRPHLRAAWERWRAAGGAPRARNGGEFIRMRRVFTAAGAGYLALLLGLPLAVLLRDAFSEGAMGTAMALANPEAWKALRLSFFLAPAVLAVNVPFGAAAAWILARHRFPGRRVLTALLDAPLALSPAVAGGLLLLVLGREGYLRWLLNPLGLRPAFGWLGTFSVLTFVTLPLVTRQVLASLRAVPARAGDAEAGLKEAFRRLLSPGLRRGVFHGAGLGLARGLGEFGALSFVGAALGGGVETGPLFVARAMDARMAAAAGAVSLALAGAAFVFTAAGESLLRFLQTPARTVKNGDGGGSPRRRRRI